MKAMTQALNELTDEMGAIRTAFEASFFTYSDSDRLSQGNATSVCVLIVQNPEEKPYFHVCRPRKRGYEKSRCHGGNSAFFLNCSCCFLVVCFALGQLLMTFLMSTRMHCLVGSQTVMSKSLGLEMMCA